MIKMEEFEIDIAQARRSRFRLRSKMNNKLEIYVTAVQQDYYTKTVAFQVLDAVENGKPVVHNWILDVIQDPSKEEFVLTQYDDDGTLLYTKRLSGLRLIGHKCNHNYECSGDDLMDHEVLFSYEKQDTIDNVN